MGEGVVVEVGYHSRWVLAQVPGGSFRPGMEAEVVAEEGLEGRMGPSGVVGPAGLVVEEEEPDPVLPVRLVS
jgi:hypothetical protein